MSISSEIKFIELSKNQYAIIDKNHFGWMRRWKWSTSSAGYAVRNDYKKGRAFLMHRVLIRAKEGDVVDHINGDPLNNRQANLRICSVSQNLMNRKINANNTSGFKGVHLLKQTGRYQAQIKCGPIRRHLGYFSTAKAAALAYDSAAIELFGEFARTNFP